eukprot:515051-Pyramimonas_sp.AAC.1
MSRARALSQRRTRSIMKSKVLSNVVGEPMGAPSERHICRKVVTPKTEERLLCDNHAHRLPLRCYNCPGCVAPLSNCAWIVCALR